MVHEVQGLKMKTFKTGRQVVDWANNTQIIVDGHNVQIIKNEMVVKVAKTSGKERKERRLRVTIDGINSIECGTESVKKGSFIKQLLKITVEQEVEQEVTDEERFIRNILESISEDEFDLDELEKMLVA